MSVERIGVAFAPVYRNPYQQLLAEGLRPYGVEVGMLAGMPTMGWLRRERGRVQILHLHWLSGLYMARVLTPLKLAAFVGRVVAAQRLGYKVVWTAHNILPHQRPFLPMHLFVRRFMMAKAAAVIVHCEYGRDELLRRFPRQRPVYVVPLGSYAGAHPAGAARDEARATLGLNEDEFAYVMVGNISPYKGVGNFITTFQMVAGEKDVAIVAGRNRAPRLVEQLEAVAAEDQRVRIYPGFIAEEMMPVYIRAADVLVFAFREILTSSSVMLAMSYGRPVIAPRLGCLPELVTAETGILYEPEEKGAFGQALREIKRMDTTVMGEAGKKIAEGLRWEEIGRETAKIYRAAMSHAMRLVPSA